MGKNTICKEDEAICISVLLSQKHLRLLVNICSQSQECEPSECWWRVLSQDTDVPNILNLYQEPALGRVAGWVELIKKYRHSLKTDD